VSRGRRAVLFVLEALLPAIAVICLFQRNRQKGFQNKQVSAVSEQGLTMEREPAMGPKEKRREIGGERSTSTTLCIPPIEHNRERVLRPTKPATVATSPASGS